MGMGCRIWTKWMGVASLCFAFSCHPSPWTWKELGDLNVKCIEEGDWIWIECSDRHQMRPILFQWSRNIDPMFMAEAWRTVPWNQVRSGDSMEHVESGLAFQVISTHSNPQELSEAFVVQYGWKEWGRQVGFESQFMMAGCMVDVKHSEEEAMQNVALGDEVEVVLKTTNLPTSRVRQEWLRTDRWTFPFGASDQLLPPLDSLIKLRYAKAEVWCLKSLGHEEFISENDTSVAYLLSSLPAKLDSISNQE